ncbi:hypothetical protein J7337_011438 [Fusarium musae]|uniref:Methyltransferase n=1 Tax=Fusarium musae TaxID=1042133 RepID=A0A9P8D7A9_9HYPO|nr:hypothetical protein J7337_011438 [Fusarium musae]KAG9496660.1 hypothetical protein J7337_011438 [Fusarium musae]
MASPKTDSAGGSPRDGVTKQNISAGSSPAGDPIIAQDENEGDASDSAFGDDASVSPGITETCTNGVLQRKLYCFHLIKHPRISQISRTDFADEHPSVEVIGTDLSPIQPSWVPPNVKFELEDATKNWSWPENYFNLVHVRFLMGAIVDWGTLFKEPSHCCKPGGFVESGEINPTFYSDDGSIDDVEALQTWNRLVIESGKGFGRSFTNIENDVQLFRDAGLVGVQSFDFKVPIGGWPKDEKMRKVGQFLRASIENDLEGYTMVVWHQIMHWPEDEYQVFLMNMRKAFKDKRIHGYMRVRYVYGRKPDADK